MSKRPTPGCPSEERILGWVDGTLEDRADLEAHVADCEHCLGVVAEIAASVGTLAGAALETPPLELERRAAGRPITETRASWRERLLGGIFSYRTAAVVAAASVAALVFIQLPERSPRDAGSVRRDGAAETASPIPRGPAGDTTAEASAVFTWEPVPGVHRYVITIVDASAGTTVVRTAVSAPSFELDAHRVADLAGHSLEWMVECTLSDGRTVQSAAVPLRFTATPGAE